MKLLRLRVANRNNKEISTQLDNSESRIQFCVSHILGWLGGLDGTQGAVEAIQRGLINLETGLL